MAPTKDTTALDARYHAQQIAERSAVAYWLGETRSEPGHHLMRVEEDFRELAEVLGYRLYRITDESAKSGKYCEVCGSEMQPDCPHGHTQVLETA